MKSFATVNIVQKRPSFGTELVVGKKYDLRDCSVPLAKATRDVRNCPAKRDVHKRFLTEVILMDNTTSYNIADIPQEIKEFLEELLRDANMTALDEKMHDDMIMELYTRLDDYMIGTITDKLPKDKMEEFTKMAEEGKGREELQEYLKNNIADTTEVFANAMIDFRNLYLGAVDNARGIPTSDANSQNTNAQGGQTEEVKEGVN